MPPESLTKAVVTKAAQKAWKRVEKAKENTDAADGATKWIKAMPLPCRNCSDDTDQATWKPMTAFTSACTKPDDLWTHVIAKGQYLQY